MPENNNGVTPTPAAPTTAAKRVEIPAGPVSGRAGEAILAQAIENALLPPAADEPKATGTAGEPAPTAPTPGEAAADPDKPNLTPEPGAEPAGDEPATEAPALTELNADEQAAVTERAKANGVTPEQQHAAETTEMTRLTAKAAELGITVEEVAAQEDAEATRPPAKTFTQDQLEEIVTKRVKNLAAENADLKHKLATKPATTTGPGPLDQVNDSEGLGTAQATAEAGMESADDLLAQLASDPDDVEDQLRNYLGEQADKHDLSPGGMRKILRNAKETFRQTLKAIPQRAQYLEAQAKTKALVSTKATWLNDQEDPRTVAFKQLERALPGIKSTPSWEYWVAAAVEKHLEWSATGKPKPNGTNGKFVPRVTFPKTASRGGAAAPRPATNADKVAAAKAALKADPTNEKKLEALLNAKMGG